MIKNENYITVQGWMRNELELKGNELIVYALIYGFSQEDDTKFTGSIGYIADWTGTSKQTVFNTLKSLQKKGLLKKYSKTVNNITFCEYRAILPPVKKFDGGVVKKFDGGGQKILPNNIDDNIDDDNIDKEKRKKKKESDPTVKAVVDYLNSVCDVHYKPTTASTKAAINARLKEGYTLQDFYTVIDKKASEWLGTEFEKYLRPSTLFGTKFENYLNAQMHRARPRNKFLSLLNEGEYYEV